MRTGTNINRTNLVTFVAPENSFNLGKMKCDDLLRLLNEYVDGTVDPAICKEFEQHLAGCDPCKVVIDTVRKTITLYKNDQPYELPVEFRERMHRTLRERWKLKHPTSQA